MSERMALLTIRALLIALSGSLFLSIVAAPYLATHARPGLAALVYLVFSPICHQNPARSFVLVGASWAVCQRCSGIYFGLFVGSLLPPIRRVFPPPSRKMVLAATAPLALDACLPLIGIWENTPASRFVSGCLFGTVLSMLLLEGLAESLRSHLGRLAAPHFNR
jgi:uncharacterized membrane protein